MYSAAKTFVATGNTPDKQNSITFSFFVIPPSFHPKNQPLAYFPHPLSLEVSGERSQYLRYENSDLTILSSYLYFEILLSGFRKQNVLKVANYPSLKDHVVINDFLLKGVPVSLP